MSPKFKLIAYAVLLILAAWFGLAFHSNYVDVTAAANEGSGENPSAAAPPPAATNAETPILTSTNALTNATTNVTAQATNSAAEATKGVGEATHTAASGTNVAAAEPGRRAPTSPAASKPVAKDVGAARGAMIGYLAGLIAAIIALGLLITIDVTSFLGMKAAEYLFVDVGDAMRDPIYERAEAEWANGSYLEAVQSLRDYLKQNPREIHAALRIAEIYEKDLKNYLAAALEYEEVLKHKLPPERWGWAAIHLCNLYSRLNHHDQTRDLLNRIVDEYPRTGAARKARERLGIAELEAEDEDATEGDVETHQTPSANVHEAEEIEEEPEPPPPEPPKPSLPPGFRPKK